MKEGSGVGSCEESSPGVAGGRPGVGGGVGRPGRPAGHRQTASEEEQVCHKQEHLHSTAIHRKLELAS